MPYFGIWMFRATTIREIIANDGEIGRFPLPNTLRVFSFLSRVQRHCCIWWNVLGVFASIVFCPRSFDRFDHFSFPQQGLGN